MPQVEKITYDEIVAQNVVINKKFILIDSSLYTAEAYSYLLSLVDKAESIAFIYDTQKIYTQGKYYGGDIWQSKLNYFGNFALLDENDSIYHTIKPEKSSDTLRLKGENNIKIYSDEVYDSNAAELIKTLKIGFDFASSVDDSTFNIGDKEYSLSINDEGKLYLYEVIQANPKLNFSELEYDSDIDKIRLNVELLGNGNEKKVTSVSSNVIPDENIKYEQSSNSYSITLVPNTDAQIIIEYEDEKSNKEKIIPLKYKKALIYGKSRITNENYLSFERVLEQDELEVRIDLYRGEYAYFACPSTYKPQFLDEESNIKGAWHKEYSLYFYSDNTLYNIYRTDNSGLGNTRWIISNYID